MLDLTKNFIAPKRNRKGYLPRASVLDQMADNDRLAFFEEHRRKIEEEVGRTVLATCEGRRHFLKSARDRMRRLERLAHAYGYWLPEPAPEKLSKAELKFELLEVQEKISEMAAALEQIKSVYLARFAA
ncbi:hypothetical protein [Neotabrizicola sp. VNH66]|uniref:hypothetical protein n=1 Tax=Neotabrizicola sp. VNH66 TaxID=3400918 RepID=UPI003C00E9D9